MEVWKSMLQQFLDHKISAQEFVNQVMDQWHKERDREKLSPEGQAALKELNDNFFLKAFRQGAYIKRVLKIYEQYRPSTLTPEGQTALQELDTKFFLKHFRPKAYRKRVLKIHQQHTIGGWFDYSVIDNLFCDVDAFCGDLELFDPKWDITEDELRRCVERALNELNRVG